MRAFLEIVLSITTVIIFLLFALKPTAQTIISLVEQIKAEKATLAVLTQKVNDLEKASALLTQNQNYLPDIDLAVSSAPAPEVFAKQAEGVAVKNNVSIIGLSMNNITLVGAPKKVGSPENVEPLPGNAYEMAYSIGVKGNYSDIDSFLKNLESLRVISRIDSVSITSSVGDAGRVIVAVISGRIPYVGSN